MSGPGWLLEGTAAWSILIASSVTGAVLAWAEWRRADRRWRAARVWASLAAVGALTLLALGPTSLPAPAKAGAAGGAEVALWTGGSRPAEEADLLRTVATPLRFRLPGVDAPEGTPTVPDAASLRRHVPHGGTLHLLGDGLDEAGLAAVFPWRVEFHPGPVEDPAPRIVAAHAPRRLGPGEPWWFAGQVRGGASGQPFTVVLDAPDAGSATAPVAADGSFRLRVPGWPTPGRFGWKLRLVGAGERVREEEAGGVSVVSPDLPRVLVLEGAPHPDTAVLRRWHGEAGGAVAVRTLVAPGRYRFSTAGQTGAEFTEVNAALLERFDLVVTDVPALAALAVPERAILRNAVEQSGLGVLVLGRTPSPHPADELPPVDQAFFLPWRLEASGEDAAATSPATEDRPVRLRWTSGHSGEETAPDQPVPVLPGRIVVNGSGGGVVLVHDGQGRAVAARMGRGQGRVAVSVATDTARWRRVEAAGAFAAFWSVLLEDLARPFAPPQGRWSLAGEAAAGPGSRVDEPWELRWQGDGKSDVVPPPGNVRAEEAPEEPPGSLPLAPDLAEPTRWATRFWPRSAGWHRVRTPPDGPPLDFYVGGAGSWPGVRAAARRAATTRFVTLNEDLRTLPKLSPSAERKPGASPPVESGTAAAGLFGVFVAAVGFLWAEARRGR